jgi:proteic killer suppression protein
MIVSYRDRRTEAFARGERVAAFSGFSRAAERALDRLEAATSLRDLMTPGLRLEKLKGDQAGRCVSPGRTGRRDRRRLKLSTIIEAAASEAVCHGA